MNHKLNFDAVIIGGGAAGMMCAVVAKSKNRALKIAVLEKNDRLGRKLMSTGNGRCNLTNKNISIDRYVGSFKKQSEKIFARFGGEDMADIFKNMGVISYFDNEGRCYPVSRHAASVLDVLRLRFDALGCEAFCGVNVLSVKKQGKSFKIIAENGAGKAEFTAEKLVIACGSSAAPKLGGSGAAENYLKSFGHKFMPFSPALCPLKVKQADVKSVKGLRAVGRARLVGANGGIIREEIGEIQFAENSLSGICVFNLSLYARAGDKIFLDLLPDYSDKELYDILSLHRSLFASRKCEELLTGIFQKRISALILRASGIDLNKNCAEFDNKKLAQIANVIKNFAFTVSGKEDFLHAQSALGGVYGREIDENTMESRIVKNLFVCGEAVDICGECGGFNLHFAFASGIIAGENL